MERFKTVWGGGEERCGYRQPRRCVQPEARLFGVSYRLSVRVPEYRPCVQRAGNDGALSHRRPISVAVKELLARRGLEELFERIAHVERAGRPVGYLRKG